jgi:hypothetical protein
VPAPKSLFGKRNERGLPIGNLTSQFWGNVYLNDLDHFVKRTLKCQQYLRYVDDMVLLAPAPETLGRWGAAMTAFLHDQLHLTLRPEMTTPFPVRQGIDFVGWKTWWNRRLPRRRTLGTCGRDWSIFSALLCGPCGAAWRSASTCGARTRLAVWHACRPCWRPMPGTCGMAPPGGPWRRCGSNTPGWQRCSGVRTGARPPLAPHRLARLCRFQAQYGYALRHTDGAAPPLSPQPAVQPLTPYWARHLGRLGQLNRTT